LIQHTLSSSNVYWNAISFYDISSQTEWRQVTGVLSVFCFVPYLHTYLTLFLACTSAPQSGQFFIEFQMLSLYICSRRASNCVRFSRVFSWSLVSSDYAFFWYPGGTFTLEIHESYQYSVHL